MNILTLIIKQSYFDQILTGEKLQEFREIRPKSLKKYCEVGKNGLAVVNDGIVQARKYDAIRFFVGYNKDRDTALVEVKDANIEIFVDEEGEFIEYEEAGEIYIMSQVVYDLGKVLEH